MGEFISKHPFLTLIGLSIICGSVINCVRIIKDPEAAKVKPIQFVFNSKKGDEKGA